jgi:hypothetical protein
MDLRIFVASTMENGEQRSTSPTGRLFLGDARLCAFLRAARMQEEELAIDLANGFLDDGMSVDFVLAAPSGASARFTLHAEPLPTGQVRVDFALWTAHRVRSGGSWEVSFSERDEVVALRRLTRAEVEATGGAVNRA